MDEVINRVQSNWSKDLIIRYLYIKLAPYFHRDLKYFLAPSAEKERQYLSGFINRFPNIVCSTLADFYVELFKKFNIQAEKIIANSSSIPLFAIIVKGDNGWYFLNPLEDLFNNQYNLKPKAFAIIPRYKTVKYNYPFLNLLPIDYIASLDDYLQIKYIDDYFLKMHKIFTNRVSANLFFGYDKDSHIDLKEDKIKFYEQHLINLGQVNGAFERAQLYNYLNEKLFNKGERNHIKVLIDGNYDNAFISINITNRSEEITYNEEKKDGQYILKRVR